MANGNQLKAYRERMKGVAVVAEGITHILPGACAQLAAAIAGEGNVVADITKRDGFDPNDPAAVLTGAERSRLAEATLVVDAIRDYVDGVIWLERERSS